MPAWPRGVVVAAVCVVLAGCSHVSEVAGPSFPTTGRLDYQLGGSYDPAAGLDVVTRDSTATPLAGAYSICYVNGFQTQPGEDDRWDDDLLLRDADGAAVTDPDWPGEFVLDPSTEQKRSRIVDVIGSVIDHCKAVGFDAVEIDNLDTYTRFPDMIDRGSSLSLAAAYADRAHGAGLSIGQKNAAGDAGDVGFDFATSEECVYFDECGSYTEAYGDRVIDIEYTDAMRGSVEEACGAADRIGMTVVRDRGLVSLGDADYFYEQC